MRIDQLTFTRFIAAILIIVFHFGPESYPFNSPSLLFIVSQANLGVSYFFLSGFVMIVAYGNQNRIDVLLFLKNRLARIYPVYFLSMGLLFTYYIWVLMAAIEGYDLLLNVTMLQSWIPAKANSFNSPGWTLSVEMFFYLLFPFLFNCFYRKRDDLNKLILPIALIWLISQIILHWFLYSEFYKGYPSESHNFIYYWPVMHLNEFLMGDLTGLFFLRRLQQKTGNYDWYILAILMVLVIAFKYRGLLIYHNGLLAILFVPLILFLSLNTGKITQWMKNKYLVFLGEISFGIYILQLPIYLFCMFVLNKAKVQEPNTRFYLFIIFLIAFSAVTYVWIETPLRAKIKQLNHKK